MLEERSTLLSPDALDLPILFEASRMLGRHSDLPQALAPLLALLDDRGGLSGGKAALGASSASGRGPDQPEEIRIAAVALERDRALEGTTIRLGEGCLGKAIAEMGPVVESAQLAVPVIAGGAPVGALGFDRPAGSIDRALRLAGAVAALVSEALVLRRRLARAGAASAAAEAGTEGGRGLDRTEAGRSIREAAPPAGEAPGGVVGSSAAMRELYAMIERVASTETTVLVTGESGTGKELVARALHERSGRASRPFVAVNCAALPESIIESELFGHEKGAFTGAQELRRGRFELADGGSLFLDEIGELSQAVQAKLLRVLQEGEYQRVGGSSTHHADVRVIAATNRDLEADAAEGRFRSDLFWRLNVFPIRVPPLRERRSDIVLLADHFAEKYGSKTGKPILRISSPAIDLLVSYHWPGNVRELENCIERAVILSTDSVIHAYHLPPSLQSAESTGTGPASTLDAALARLERELVVEALKICKGNAAAAARRLGVTERRMGLAIHRYRIDWRRFRTSR